MKRKNVIILVLAVLLLISLLTACGTNVTFKIDFIVDGAVIHTIDTKGNEEIQVPTDPEKEGYIFDGWYWDKDTWEKPFTANSLLNAPLSENMSVYAKWKTEGENEVQTYTITFNSNGGGDISAITKEAGESITEPTAPTKTGYTFDGWYTDDDTFLDEYTFSTMPAESFTLYAKWIEDEPQPVTYTITFNSNGGGDISAITKEAGESITAPTAPTKTGYTFDGWYTDDDTFLDEYTFSTMPAESFTLYAKWTINQYTISFNSNGGSAVVAITQDYDTEVSVPTAPTRDYYTFNGWYTDDGTFSNAYTFTTMPADNITVFAKWTINQYTISFNSNGGSDVVSITQDYGTEVDEPAEPTKEGYTFDGWYTDNDTFVNEYIFSTIAADDTILYANWTINQYTISFNSNGGSDVVSITQDYGTEVDEPAEPTKEGYTFDGWYTDNDTFVNEYIFSTIAADDTILYANWTINQYTISFNSNGGSDVVSITQDYGTEVDEPAEPTKEGYTFDGWYTDNDTFVNEYIFSTIAADDTILYANWTINQYTISFNSNGGSDVVSITQDYGTEVDEPAEPTKEGYTFDGWYTDNDTFVNEYIFSTIAADDTILYANWTINQYTISFNSNGGSDVVSITQDYGTEVDEPAEPTKEGYTFDGWYTDNDTFVNEYIFSTIAADDTILYANWTINQYTISFNSNGGSDVVSITQDYGTEVDEPAEPTKEGYTFDGWYTDNDTFVNEYIFSTIAADDTILYANWTINQYTISFNSNGGSDVVSITQDYGTEVDEPAEPTKEGYTFDGWYTDNDTFVNEYIFSTIAADDTILYANWTINQYTISFNSNGGSDVVSITQDYGTEVDEPAEPTKEGYTFDGWYTDNDTFVNEYIFSTIAADDTILYANWTINQYTISFNSNGGSDVVSITQDYGTEVDEPAEPTKEGYTFDGWYTDNDTFVNEYIFSTIAADDTILYANWTINQYTISFNSNGGSDVVSITQDYGTEVDEPAEPTKEGYTFDGWYTDNGTFLNGYTFSVMPAESVTLYAKWLEYQRINASGEPAVDGDYILFGEYPQTIKANGVTVGTSADTRGYYLGSDDCYYAKVTATPRESGYTFSTNATVTSGTVYYFKVEPIKWRILTESGGTALILCESIIANKRYDDSSNNYMNSEIRAWLNIEFYNTAFNTLQQELIQTTEVDNSVYSTGYSSNPYTCANTNDKIFLPSYREMVNTAYGFSSDYTAYDTARRRLTSDYSRATGVWMSTDTTYYGSWWLRSPDYSNSGYARGVYINGIVGDGGVSSAHNGVVPALVIDLR